MGNLPWVAVRVIIKLSVIVPTFVFLTKTVTPGIVSVSELTVPVTVVCARA